MADALTKIITGIICSGGGSKRINVLDVLLRYNDMVFRGDALCTNWVDVELSIGGRRYGFVACGSVLYALDYLASVGAIRIGRDGSIDLLDVELCGGSE